MRQLPSRPKLPKATVRLLEIKTALIAASTNQAEKAASVYANSRKTKWFSVVIDALQRIAGPGERCMLCSGSESSDVEHFRPKSKCPDRAMTWENFLWSCTICNRAKTDDFPTPEPINPLDENVWSFFFLDEFGNMTPTWRAELNDLDPRGRTTEKLIGLNRQALQESRRRRRKEIIQVIQDSIARFRSGQLTKESMKLRLDDLVNGPFQPDVADFYLRGPGASEEPFHTFLQITQSP